MFQVPHFSMFQVPIVLPAILFSVSGSHCLTCHTFLCFRFPLSYVPYFSLFQVPVVFPAILFSVSGSRCLTCHTFLCFRFPLSYLPYFSLFQVPIVLPAILFYISGSHCFTCHTFLCFRFPLSYLPYCSLFQVPIVLPAILCLVSLGIVCLTFYQKVSESLTALLILAVGTLLYILGNRWNTKPKSLQSKISEYFEHQSNILCGHSLAYL